MAHIPMLERALHYAARGWPVFAVSYSKVPFRGSHGFLDATTDRAMIERYWDTHRRANVALATGKLVVFDCDGDAGLARFLALGRGPRTLVARTPRGGWHFYYQAPEGVTIRSKAEARPVGLHDGLDIRGAGGFVVLPPSVTKDGAYTWALEHPIAPIPDYLLDFAQSIGARGPSRAGGLPLPTHLLAYRLTGAPRPVHERAIAGMETEWSAHEQARIASALNSIGKNISYDDFLKIGFSLHSLNWVKPDGTDGGFELWDQWAERFPETYNLAGLEKKWESFGRGEYPHRTITIGTLYHLASEAGWDGQLVQTTNATMLPSQHPAAVSSVPDSPLLRSTSAVFAAQPAGTQADADAINGTPLALPAAFLANAIVFPDTDRNGNPRATCTNAVKAIEALGIDCRRDVFHEKMLVGGHTIEAWAGDLSDDCVAMLRHVILDQYGFDPGERNARDAAVRQCLLHQFNPVTDYLDSLEWDQRPRIARWPMLYLGTPEITLAAEFGRLMLIAAVRRARRPGTKFDQIIILEGPQGIGKSSAIRILAGEDNFSDQHIISQGDREQQEAFRGVWLHEIAELAGLRRTDIERVKQFARRTEDRARPAYGRFRIDVKRRGIFVATTNEQAYLKEWDRAFWPIACGAINLATLERDRDQLWAEAATIEASGAALELPESMRQQAAEQIAERQEIDTWEDMVLQVVAGKSVTSINEILTGNIFHMAASELSQANQNRVARILKKLGFERYQIREGAARHWKYKLLGTVVTSGD